MTTKMYDAIIIGSGQAGTPLAFKLAARGQKVAFIEKYKIGGSCYNVGCTPTKIYVASARRVWELANSSDLGITIDGTFLADFQKIYERKNKFVESQRLEDEEDIEKNDNIDLFYDTASFISDKEVKVQDTVLTAEKIFINVGTRPFVPKEYQNVPYLTNETILELTSLPEHLAIIGGSYIGLEFGQIFRRFGSKVTIIERGSRVISKEDPEVSEAITDFMRKEGVEFVFNAKKIEPRGTQNGVAVSINNEIEINASHLLLGVGRTPNTDTLRLENTQVNLSPKGFIEVDDFCQTNIDGVFAMGDCNGRGSFTHTAYNDYQIVEDFLYGGKQRKISDRIQTYGLFTDPPLGRCGLTKQQALEKGMNILEGRTNMNAVQRALIKGETDGFMSVLVDADTEKIVGACVLGTGGDEIITSILNMMIADKSYKLIRDSVVIHPTVSELIPTTLEILNPVGK